MVYTNVLILLIKRFIRVVSQIESLCYVRNDIANIQHKKGVVKSFG